MGVCREVTKYRSLSLSLSLGVCFIFVFDVSFFVLAPPPKFKEEDAIDKKQLLV